MPIGPQMKFLLTANVTGLCPVGEDAPLTPGGADIISVLCSGCVDAGVFLQGLLGAPRAGLVILVIALGAGDRFHKRVRKRTIVSFIMDRTVLADGGHRKGVFQIGNASST